MPCFCEARRGAGTYRPPPTAAAAASPPSLRDESTLGSKTTNPTGDHVTDKILALNCSLHTSLAATPDHLLGSNFQLARVLLATLSNFKPEVLG